MVARIMVRSVIFPLLRAFGERWRAVGRRGDPSSLTENAGFAHERGGRVVQFARRDSVSRGAEAHTGRSERPTNAIAGGGRLDAPDELIDELINVFSLPCFDRTRAF
jgi:hypothetical protein